MVLIFFVDDGLMFSYSQDKIDDVYAYLRAYFNIEDYGDLNKYIGIEMERSPYVSIHPRNP